MSVSTITSFTLQFYLIRQILDFQICLSAANITSQHGFDHNYNQTCYMQPHVDETVLSCIREIRVTDTAQLLSVLYDNAAVIV